MGQYDKANQNLEKARELFLGMNNQPEVDIVVGYLSTLREVRDVHSHVSKLAAEAAAARQASDMSAEFLLLIDQYLAFK
jgi:hypothetical protein